jgi:spore maturation protein CgeB
MLRIANYYESRLGRNDGNPLYITHALKQLESKGILLADHLIPNGDTKYFGKYDLGMWMDWGEDGLTGLIPYQIQFPKEPFIYWASDTHIHQASYQYRMETAKKASLVFVAQKDAVERFKADGVTAPVYWMPHAFEPTAYNDPESKDGNPFDVQKKYDLCFVGHVSSQNRIDALDRVFREFPNFYYGQKLFNDAALKYAQSKIVFNIAMKNDVNMRCFETLGSRSFLLTDRIDTIEEIFEDGKHLVLYDSLNDMVEKARYYLSHDDERRKIAEAGYRHVIQNHTFEKRLQFMLEKAREHNLIGEPVHA